MDKNEEMICDDCGQTFQSSSDSQSPIKHCPKCVEKIQEEMLKIMFGESDTQHRYESAGVRTKYFADYSSESADKVLDYHSLIEAIHEYFDPTTDHDFEYLELRINLLRKVFGIDSKSIDQDFRAIDQLLMGFGKIVPVSVLPFEGALELPQSIDTEAHIFIEKKFHTQLREIKEIAYEIQRAYITYIIQHSINPRLRSKTVTLRELISSGLASHDPGSEYDD